MVDTNGYPINFFLKKKKGQDTSAVALLTSLADVPKTKRTSSFPPRSVTTNPPAPHSTSKSVTGRRDYGYAKAREQDHPSLLVQERWKSGRFTTSRTVEHPEKDSDTSKGS